MSKESKMKILVTRIDEECKVKMNYQSNTGNLREAQNSPRWEGAEKEWLGKFFVSNISDIYIIFPMQ